VTTNDENVVTCAGKWEILDFGQRERRGWQSRILSILMGVAERRGDVSGAPEHVRRQAADNALHEITARMMIFSYNRYFGSNNED